MVTFRRRKNKRKETKYTQTCTSTYTTPHITHKGGCMEAYPKSIYTLCVLYSGIFPVPGLTYSCTSLKVRLLVKLHITREKGKEGSSTMDNSNGNDFGPSSYYNVCSNYTMLCHLQAQLLQLTDIRQP